MHAYIQNTSERFRYRKGGKKIISLANLSTFPRFLLFDRVILFYNKGSNEIEGKCQKIKKYMHPIKDALKDSIRFVGRIDQDDRECFRHHSMLLEHLRVLGLVDTIGIEYRVSKKYRDFSGIGIDPSIGV